MILTISNNQIATRVGNLHQTNSLIEKDLRSACILCAAWIRYSGLVYSIVSGYVWCYLRVAVFMPIGFEIILICILVIIFFDVASIRIQQH